jgi:hypothetical protein
VYLYPPLIEASIVGNIITMVLNANIIDVHNTPLISIHYFSLSCLLPIPINQNLEFLMRFSSLIKSYSIQYHPTNKNTKKTTTHSNFPFLKRPHTNPSLFIWFSFQTNQRKKHEVNKASKSWLTRHVGPKPTDPDSKLKFNSIE